MLSRSRVALVTDSLRDTIEPNSDQLNADDLITGPITVTIEGVKRGSSDQPIDVMISGHRPYRPCKSMRRVLIAAWGDRGSDWIGKSLILYRDPNVKFGGVAVGGIRISHLSDIDGPLKIMLTANRQKRAPFEVEPLHPSKTPQATRDQSKYEGMLLMYKSCSSDEFQMLEGERRELWPTLSQQQKIALKKAVDQRRQELGI